MGIHTISHLDIRDKHTLLTSKINSICMRQVARFCLENYTQRDFEYLYSRSALLKIRGICMFEINKNFDRKLTFELKSVIRYFKSKKKTIYLDVRDSANHDLILGLLPFADAIKIKYEYLTDQEKLASLLERTLKLNIPVIVYFKTTTLHDFIDLYESSNWHYPNLYKVVDIEKINPSDIVRVLADKSIFLLDCPICVAEKLGVRTCTSGILDVYMNVYKTGRKLKFEEVNQYEQAKFFKKSGFCNKCICGGRCLGNRLDTVSPNILLRNEEVYSSAADIFEQFYISKTSTKASESP